MSEAETNQYELVYPAADYHEDYGTVLWWRFPVCEPPCVGNVDDIDNYTHFSRMPIVWDGDGMPKHEPRHFQLGATVPNKTETV